MRFHRKPEMEPLVAFVGDIINYQGVLTSGDELPGEREIGIRANREGQAPVPNNRGGIRT
jgi:hypothetical protein